MKQIFKRDVIYDNLDEQQRNDSYQLHTEANMLNLDSTLNKLKEVQERRAKLLESLGQQKADNSKLLAKIDGLVSQEQKNTDAQDKEATQEQRTDSEKRLDQMQEDYLTSRGLKKYPKLDECRDNYLSHRGLNPNNAIATQYDSIF